MIAIEADLGASWASGLGRPRARFDHHGGALFAVVGLLPLLSWPGRSIYSGHRLRHRLMLFRRSDLRRVACLDEARWLINDVAFHPTEPIAAVATGSYDGGWAFEGELLIWNWQTGAVTRPLGEEREIVRCRFDDAQRLTILLRPRTEEEFGEDSGLDPFEVVMPFTLTDLGDFGPSKGIDPRLENLTPGLPESFGFAARSSEEDQEELMAELSMLGHEARHHAWDVRWLDDTQIAAVTEQPTVEVWSLDGSRAIHAIEVAPGDRSAHGVQILPGPERTLVNVLVGKPIVRSVSRLYELTPGGLRLVHALEHAYTFSRGAGGMLLGRAPRHFPEEAEAKDILFDAHGDILKRLHLGAFDTFNHALRLDGDEGPFFLQGTPAISHQKKRLCRIDARGEVTSVMSWDGPGPIHLMESSAVACDHGTIVRGYRVYDPRPSVHPSFVERVTLAEGYVLWKVPIEVPPVALCHVAATGAVVVATLDGRVRVLDVATGDVLANEVLQVDGLTTVVMSLDARGDRIAAGTLDGRVLVMRVAR
jgi:hypothetical protein